MEQCVKGRLMQLLRHRNYFDCGKKDSLEILEKAQHLEDVAIQVERSCNVDKLFFRYNPVTGQFHRIAPTKNDQALLRREVTYNVRKTCIDKQCFKKKIDVESFFQLLETTTFEPIGVFNVNDIVI